MITANQARNIVTQKLQAIYDEKIRPTGFLRSFFPNNEGNTKLVSISVRRGKERVAVDVQRGTGGNRNQFGRSSQKVFKPPYYYEYFDATDLDFYDVLFLSNNEVDPISFANWLNEIEMNLDEVISLIERAYELQCAQVLQTGIVTLVNGDNIDFKRKAASLVDGGAPSRWTVATNDPNLDLESGAKFIRTKGKAQGSAYNVIMGADAYNAYVNNPFVKERADIRNFQLDAIRAPQRDSQGGTLHGEVSSGSYKFRIWSYPEYYDTEAAENIPYIDDSNIIILPESPNFQLSFAAVPQLIGATANVGAGVAGMRGAYLIGEFLDQKNVSHEINAKSAGIAVPVAVDQIYTQKVTD